ncbi:MAG: ribonuclease HII [Patescibacteria group bacterium]
MHYEKKLHQQGYKFIAGIDEAGRGAWAGPLFVGAVILPVDNLKVFKGIKDSKKILPEKRVDFFEIIISQSICYAIGRVESHEIDQLGMQSAHLLAVERAFSSLSQYPDYVLVDRIAKVKFPVPFENVIKGDDKFITVGAASIIAKVARDREMTALAKQYPQFEFNEHKGYGTPLHQKKIAQYGLCPIHRRLFGPIRDIDKDRRLF